MRKKILTASLILGAFVFTACGSRGSTESYSSVVVKDGVKYTCNTEEAFEMCSDENNCSACTSDIVTDSNESNVSSESNVSNESNITAESNVSVIPECTKNGSIVLVDEATTCTDGTNSVSCIDNRVTYNGTISGEKININGKVYTCQ